MEESGETLPLHASGHLVQKQLSLLEAVSVSPREQIARSASQMGALAAGEVELAASEAGHENVRMTLQSRRMHEEQPPQADMQVPPADGEQETSFPSSPVPNLSSVRNAANSPQSMRTEQSGPLSSSGQAEASPMRNTNLSAAAVPRGNLSAASRLQWDVKFSALQAPKTNGIGRSGQFCTHDSGLSQQWRHCDSTCSGETTPSSKLGGQTVLSDPAQIFGAGAPLRKSKSEARVSDSVSSARNARRGRERLPDIQLQATDSEQQKRGNVPPCFPCADERSSELTTTKAVQGRMSDDDHGISEDSGVVLVPMQLEVTELRLIQAEYQKYALDSRGLDREQFAQVVGNSWGPTYAADAETCFDLFDVDKSGYLTLREFVCGYAVLCRGSTEQRVRYLFSMFDESGDGMLHPSELFKVMSLLHKLARRVAFAQGKAVLERKFSLGSSPEHSQLVFRSDSVPDGDCIDVESAFRRVAGSRNTMQFSEFYKLCTEDLEMSSWLDELSFVADEHLKTLRRTKEHEMISLELERMGLLDPVVNVPATLQASPGLKHAQNQITSSDDERDAHTGASSGSGVGSGSASYLNGDFKPQAGGPLSANFGHLKRENSTASSASIDLDLSVPNMHYDSRDLSRNGSVAALNRSMDSTSSLTLAHHTSSSLKAPHYGPTLVVRRAMNANSITESPFAIDYDSLRLKKIIGKGSFATVWAAEWLHMPVAVKVFHDQDDDDTASLDDNHREAGSDGLADARAAERRKDARARRYASYLREIELLSQLRHPNVLLYMGACLSVDRPFCIVTELYNGGSVYDLLQEHRLKIKESLRAAVTSGSENGAQSSGASQARDHMKNNSSSSSGGGGTGTVGRRYFGPVEALNLALGVARGMLYLHSSSPVILHRDLKTSNILLDRHRSHCVICDFGLSRIGERSGQASASLSAHGATAVGTAYTMAPEIMEGNVYTPAADVYSFGIVFWEIWTCRMPFEGLKPIQLMFQVYSEDLRPDFEEEDHFHPLISELIRRCWHADQRARPTFGEILDILESERLHEEIESLSRTLKASAELVEMNGSGDLMETVTQGNVEGLRKLLNAGVPPSLPDYDRRTPLHIAAAEGRLDIAKLLVESGANVNARDRWGSSPLQDAERENRSEMIAFLKESGAVEFPSQHGMFNPTYLLSLQLMGTIHEGSIPDIESLLAMGASVTFEDYDHRTPLHVAASEGRADVVKLLIERGADISAVDRWGSTPLQDAQRVGHRQIALLIEVASDKSNLSKLGSRLPVALGSSAR
ncbi:putative serine/threonine-protein kinase [Porphyridium purpureum]|uniref:Putative serine/threonine-protein kinase n=1 Tax=Porphyridium purpureum TaxID=35688 RepID=A0A5J4Z4Q5_PORPP|nr:putative serine/threonine-protein kinase [Porphyridium purpureum]|eukprot:POR4786..scf295_1